MALVMADLSESQRETLINLIFQRGVELTALTVDQLREFLITLIHAPKSSLENPSSAHMSGPRSFIAISYVVLTNMKDIGFRTSSQVMRAFSTSMRISSGSMTTSSAFG